VLCSEYLNSDDLKRTYASWDGPTSRKERSVLLFHNSPHFLKNHCKFLPNYKQSPNIRSDLRELQKMFSLKLNLQCLDTGNIVRYLFFHMKVDYWWHWEIQFVCMWLVLQNPEGWKVWRLADEGGDCEWGKWSDFIRGSTKQMMSNRCVEVSWVCAVHTGFMGSLPFTALNTCIERRNNSF
jgi:hypothetical protein